MMFSPDDPPRKNRDAASADAPDLARELAELRAERATLRAALARATQEQAWLEEIVRSSSDPIISKDLSGTIRTWNPAAAALFGYTNTETVGRPLARLVPPELAHEEASVMARLARGEATTQLETVRLTKTGERVSVTVTISPLRDRAGRVIGAAKFVRDLTSARAAAALQESEERLNTVIENLTEGLVISNRDGELLHWNRAALDMHGFATVEECRRRLPEFATIFELATVEGAVLPLDQWPLPRIIRGEVLRDVEIRIRKLAGDWERIVSYGGALVRDAMGRQLAFVRITDITDRKRAEEAVREAAAFNRQILLGASEGIVVLDRELRYQVFNPAAEAITGWKAADMLGRSLREIFPAEVVAQREPHLRRVLGGEAVGPSDLYLADIDAANKRWISSRTSSLRNGDGEVIGVIVVLNDITERKATEQALREAHIHLEARVQERTTELAEATRRAQSADRLKSEFLANMSHELRTPLNGIIGFTELLVDGRPGPLNPKQQQFLTAVLNSGRHLLQLINDVLDLSKIEAGKMELLCEVVALPALIAQVCASLAPIADAKHIQLTHDVAPALCDLWLDKKKLTQVLYNLLSNALKFTPERGTVTVTGRPNEEGFQIGVSDSGIGIKPEDLGKLFVEFQQLESGKSRRFQGTGLGLALTRRLVQLHGGRIAVASEPGRGSTFTVQLPCHRPPAAA